MDKLDKLLKPSTSQPDIPDQKTYKEPTRAERLSWYGVTDASHTFASMKKPHGFAPVLTAFEVLASGAADFQLLMVYGGVGNGKTRCCEATVIAMYDKGIYVRRDRWSDLVRTMKAHFNGKGTVSYDEYFTGIRQRARLILDDVGSGSTLGQWEWGELEDIIDYRYEHRLFTILTTNIDIKVFPERILSRFRDKSRARLILNEAVDQRPAQVSK